MEKVKTFFMVQSILSIALGAFLLINTKIKILGAVIGQKINLSDPISITFGSFFLIAGIILYIAQEKESLEKKVESKQRINPDAELIKTRRFEKAIKKYQGKERQKILDAAEQIRHGLGKPEFLTNLRSYSVRASQRGRILYDHDDKGNIVLKDYIPDHY